MTAAAPSLSVCVVTYAPAARLRRFLLAARDYADELVVTLDSRCEHDAVAQASALADSVALADLDGLAERARGWTAERARGDWILALDDDELMAPGFRHRLPDLLTDRFSHYHLPVRWVVPGPDGSPRWLRQFPWFPNQATRLFRNVAGTFRQAARLHSVWEVAGDGCSLQEPDAAIYHLTLAQLTRSEREHKIRDRYRPLAGAEWPTCEEYYLYEDYAETLEYGDVPSEVAQHLAADPGPRWIRAASRSSAPERIDSAERVDSAELDAHIQERCGDPPIWSAEYLAHSTPERWFTNRGCVVEVTVRNTSEATWGSSGSTTGRVVLSYRWRDLDGRIVVAQGDVALLPQPCRPGEVARFVAGFWTPRQAGGYVLEWDMLCERVGWFSERGVPPLRCAIEIAERGPRPEAPHFPVSQPGPQPARARPPAPEAVHARAGRPLVRLRRRWQAF